ncbi:isatin hydrolase-like [Uloborus diversus]|uniref:isatin hydrolase-like n=1 Tax=Uloborus diversus TaxID=327109 RepID=UPI0024096E19|nr:isatin hydrolase-like [Uloborus diversus]
MKMNKISSMKRISYIILLFLVYNVRAAPISKRMVDLTYVFDETTLKHPIHTKFELTVVVNGTQDGGFWLQNDDISGGSHAGTHMDAPAHFSPGGLEIDQIPISHFIAPAAVIDITAKAELNSDAEVTVEDLMRWEETTGQDLNHKIVLVRSGWGRRWSNRTAFFGTPEDDGTKLHFPGVSGDAAQWLVNNRDIYGLGIDTLSFDRGNSVDFPTHRILLGHGIFGLENVANMEQIPISGAMLHVMPMKLGKASGAPTRIIATYPEVIF